MDGATPAAIFDNFWLAWIIAFVVIEVVALFYNAKYRPEKYQGGTLSELVWRIMKENRFFKTVLILFFVVLGAHFILG